MSGAIALADTGTIYLATTTDSEPTLIVLSSNGVLKQRYRPNGGVLVVDGTLVAADGTIYGTKNILNRTYAFALEPGGREVWSGPQESETLALAADGTALIRQVSELVAFDSHRKVLWQARLPENPNETEAHEPTKAPTLSADGKMYIGDFLGRLGVLQLSPGLAREGWPSRFHDPRNTSRAGAR